MRKKTETNIGMRTKKKLTSSAPINTFQRFCSNVLQISRELSVTEPQPAPIVSNQILPPTIPITNMNVIDAPTLSYIEDDVVAVVVGLELEIEPESELSLLVSLSFIVVLILFCC